MDPFLSLTHFLYLKLVFNILIFYTISIVFPLAIGEKKKEYIVIFMCHPGNKYISLVLACGFENKGAFVRNKDIKF